MVHPLGGLDNHRPSSDQPPAGNLPACAWGDRFIPYPGPLQARPSLLPASFTSYDLKGSCEPSCPVRSLPVFAHQQEHATTRGLTSRTIHVNSTSLNHTCKDVRSSRSEEPDAIRGFPRSTRATELRGLCLSAGDAPSACADQAATHPITLRFGLGLSNALAHSA